MKYIKLSDALQFVKNALKTPYHFYQMTDHKMIVITLEDKSGKRYTFTGTTIFNSVENAVGYVEAEISAGSIKDPRKEKQKKEETKEEKDKSKITEQKNETK